MVATGHALRLLEESAAGRIRQSAWVNIEFARDGLFRPGERKRVEPAGSRRRLSGAFT
jgi:hypothetical protein